MDSIPLEFISRVSRDGTRASLVSVRMNVVPEWLRSLTELTALDLSGNPLSAIPEWIGSFPLLTELYLRGNGLLSIPESIGNLTKLDTLNVSNNQLTSIPESIANLTRLTTLNVSDNRLLSIPESIGNVTRLDTLNVSNNQLTSVPESIGNLTRLDTLKSSNNQLTNIPDSIEDLAALTTLNLSDNQLTSLPESIGDLAALRTLNLSNNRLTSLPESIGNLRLLGGLNLAGNHMTKLPMQLADLLDSGLALDVRDNPLGDPLAELVYRGTDAIAIYLRSLKDAEPQFEAKMLLLGEGNVGKTSLVAALRGMPFVKDRLTTHGIEISALIFKHPTFDLDMTLRTWDFGGQEVYRVSHQFFFSRRALYAVVWNARDGQEQDEVESWLRRIRLRVGDDARVIVVATHCEDRLPELDYPHLRQIFPHMLAGSFDVDNRTNTGIARLREGIAHEAAQLPQMGQEISPRWMAARDEILAHATAEPQIWYERFAEICRRQGVIGAEITTLAEFMHDLGHIIYYGEDEGLRDIVVLNPAWLTKAISYVLEDKPTRDAGGILDHTRLKGIWLGRSDGPTYPALYHPYFLRLMEKFDISYRLEGDELHSLVAQLVPHERPALPWQLKEPSPAGIRSLALVCRLSEPAPGIIPWLTVRHHRSSTGLYWRRGVFLRHPVSAYASEALLELSQPVELTVEVRAPSPDLYFNVLRDSIEDLITRRWPGLVYRFFVPCPGKAPNTSACTGQFPLDGLLRLRENGYTTYACTDCVQEHDISFLLTGFAVPDRSLATELQRMSSRLSSIESGITRIEVRAAEIAAFVRRMLRVVSSEVIDCPRLVTLSREQPTLTDRARFYQNSYRMTLWCEYPDAWHPWELASYRLDAQKQWFRNIVTG